MKAMRTIFPVVMGVLITASACQQDSSPGTPTPPPPPSAPGMIAGRLDPATNTISFEPLAMAASYSGAVSPATYGNQGVTVSVYGTVDSTITVAGVSKTWFIRIGFRNLESYPIGSNYSSTNPPDTAGVFLFFANGAPIVTAPTSCSGCAMTVQNAMGTGNFNAPGQKYFWYHNRLQALQGSPGSDTSYLNPEWQIKANSDQVTGFAFVLMVDSYWPAPFQSSWTGTWVAALDSTMDDYASPDWHEYAVAGDPILGIDVMRGTTMALIAPDSNSSIYMARNDSLGDMSAALTVAVRDSASSSAYQAEFGIVEPSGGKQVFIGLGGDLIDFLSFSEGTGVWSRLANSASCKTGGSNGCDSNKETLHSFSLRKFARDSVVLCVDGYRRMQTAYSNLQATQPSFSGGTIVVGSRSSDNVNKTSYWTSVSYTIGTGAAGTITSGGICGP